MDKKSLSKHTKTVMSFMTQHTCSMQYISGSVYKTHSYIAIVVIPLIVYRVHAVLSSTHTLDCVNSHDLPAISCCCKECIHTANHCDN